ncbi:MAG: hypothetical protein ACM3UY_11520 [Methanocella sp.]|jgi:hypothetical protein
MSEPQPSGIPNFEGGEVLVSTGDLKVMQVNLSSARIDVNVEDKAFIKRLIAMRNQLIPKKQGAEEKEAKQPQAGGILSTARKIADALCSRGITITVSYRGQRIATLGAEAHPTLLQYITKTRGIALNSVVAAIKMVI